MPRFTPDSSKADASVPVYPKGLYQVKVVSHRPSIFVSKKDNETKACVQFRLEMVGRFDEDGELDRSDEGRPVRDHTCWLHTEKAAGMNKQFYLAALGYTEDEEQVANDEFFDPNSEDEWIDGEPEDKESQECGPFYDAFDGKLVNVYLDTEIYEDNEQQRFARWSPAA